MDYGLEITDSSALYTFHIHSCTIEISEYTPEALLEAAFGNNYHEVALPRVSGASEGTWCHLITLLISFICAYIIKLIIGEYLRSPWLFVTVSYRRHGLVGLTGSGLSIHNSLFSSLPAHIPSSMMQNIARRLPRSSVQTTDYKVQITNYKLHDKETAIRDLYCFLFSLLCDVWCEVLI